MTQESTVQDSHAGRDTRPRFKLRALLVFVTVICLLIGAIPAVASLYYQWTYPYGHSHCCDKALMFALHDYANANAGRFPAGEGTPEASLGLLYPKLADANLLRGKTVPEDVVKAVFEQGERLGPETCGWHYVEGLTQNDDPGLALFWDKVGLDHNGGRLSDGGHFVCFVGMGDIRYIRETEWGEFLENQRRLHATRTEKSAN